MTDKKTKPDAPATKPAVPDAPVTSDARVSRRRESDAAEGTAPGALPEPPPADAARPVSPRRPHRPRFGISQGTAEELARTGQATDPFTGEHLEDPARLAEVRAAASRRGESAPRRSAG